MYSYYISLYISLSLYIYIYILYIYIYTHICSSRDTPFTGNIGRAVRLQTETPQTKNIRILNFRKSSHGLRIYIT